MDNANSSTGLLGRIQLVDAEADGDRATVGDKMIHPNDISDARGAAGASAPRGAAAAGRPNLEAESSSRLMDVGEPDLAGQQETVVVVRLSSASSSEMTEALQSSGVGIMETKQKAFSSKTANASAAKAGQVRRSNAKTGAGGGTLVSSSAAAKGAGKIQSPETVEAPVPWHESLESHSSGAKDGQKRLDGDVAATTAPACLDIEENRGVTTLEVVQESSVDEGIIRPGAVAVFPTDMPQSQRDVDVSFGSRHSEQNPYGEIKAEAHLVEDVGPVASAKRESPLVRFVQDHCILVSVLVLLVIGGIAGLSAYLTTRSTATNASIGCQGEDCVSASSHTESPTWSFPPSASLSPSAAPTTNPTSAPTLPCDMTPEERAGAISDAMAVLALDPDSPEEWTLAHSRARKWLAESDDLDPPLCPNGDEERLKQRFGLALLHFEGRGEEWTYRSFDDKFLSGVNECQWAGVGCDLDTHKVTKIELPGRNMRGTLPGHLFTIFEGLKVLDLQGNLIRGCLPDGIGMASNLTHLYLSANELTCGLPSTLPGTLEEIDFFGNRIRGSIPGVTLTGLDKLKMLRLGKNQLTGSVPKEIENLKALVTLHLHDNKFYSSLPMEFFNLTNLVSLRLSENSFNSTLSSSISRLSMLKELYLHENRFSGSIPEDVFLLGEIKNVALSENRFAGTLPEQIGTAKSLEVLRLDNTRISGTLPASVSQLGSLEVLSIQETRIRGNVSQEICSLDADIEGGHGSLTKLYAECDEDGDCVGSRGVCCQCCDCVPRESTSASSSSSDDEKVYLFCSPIIEEIQFASDDDQNGTLPFLRSELIIQSIMHYNVSDENLLLQASSPQGRAASWIINRDELQLNATDPSLLQRYVMAVLYFSTNGDDWLRCSATEGSSCGTGSAFLSNVSVCDWYGVTCTSRGYITSVRLEYNSLAGTVPIKELSGLCLEERALSFRGNSDLSFDFLSKYVPRLVSELRELDLSECALTGQLNYDILRPQRVYLNDNRLNGTIPDRRGPSSLRMYRGLQSLHLQYNLLSGSLPNALRSATSLKELRLDNNILTGTIPDIFDELQELEFLTLNNNELFGSVPDGLCDATFDNGGELEDLW
eukprot:CAMPEP_0197437964 /NCGR_PEP_ID=MMETSP1175-20131217/5086_1 /TAXON_ID=1003142 /ORGANISM="Triceratium dubium, Strain CCMP147" /LENGTH=1104 /DNA_ID=CAMNT_0042967607 /DNA_START=265 /DNA_END=3576 /DNA_ORIENTATION=+